MKEIQLTQGQVAFVDDEDYERISAHKWCAAWHERTHGFYATRKTPRNEGKHTILMHREVMGLEIGDPRQVDHRTPSETLNNCKSNLRIATHAQQQYNTRIPRNNTSGFKGVTRRGPNEWATYIAVNKKGIYLGSFRTGELAAEAYKAASAKYHGEFGRTDSAPRIEEQGE
ncbi:MAG TPA: hypothetical protein VN666_22035 [Nitrospira sp.]|nr:hypothetical protein [Nitrospira sp.]